MLEREIQHVAVETSRISSEGYDRQLDLIKSCARRNSNLPEALRAEGLDYDDLRYLDDSRPSVPRDNPIGLNDLVKDGIGVPVVSFFSGAGGLDLGFEAAGFDHLLLSEKNPLFCETLKLNRAHWDVVAGDIADTPKITAEITKRVGRAKQFEGVFVGGPPCQPFSIAANQRFSKSGENFKRVGFSHVTNGNLLLRYVSLILRHRPRVFLIENVPGLLEMDGGKQLNSVYEELTTAGYTIHRPIIAKAEYFGVPQSRTRLFIVGYRGNKAFTPPEPESRPLACGGVFTRTLANVKNHVTRQHSAESVLRYMQLGYGERDQLGRVDRLDPTRPSKTVIAGGTAGGGRSHLHPYIPRTISVRECARLQTFPEDYEFVGPVARQFTQVGNAVPPVLAAKLAIAIRKSFFS